MYIFCGMGGENSSARCGRCGGYFGCDGWMNGCCGGYLGDDEFVANLGTDRNSQNQL